MILGLKRHIGFGLLVLATSACSTSFRPRAVTYSSIARIKFNSFQFIEIPRIGFTGQQAHLIEGFCKTPGQTVDYSVPGTHIAGSTPCQFDSQLLRKYWRTTVDFSSMPDGAVIVMAQERRGSLIEELGILESKKDTSFCSKPENNGHRATQTIPPVAESAGDSEFDIHLICNATQWNTLAADSREDARIRKARILLRNHIDFTGVTVKPIHHFEGELVGGGFSLMHATSFQSEDAPTGFFGDGFRGKINSPDAHAWLSQIDPWDLYLLIDRTVVQNTENNTHPIGGLIGRMTAGTVSNVWGRSILVEGTQYTGGLVGQIGNSTTEGNARLKNILMERSSAIALQHSAGGLVGSVGTGGIVQDTKLFLASATAPYRSGGLAGVNAGKITSVHAVAGGSTDARVLNPELPTTRSINIDHSAGGLVGINTSSGVIERILVSTQVFTGLTSEIAFSGADAGGIIGVNDGTLAMAFLDTVWAGGSINTGCVVGHNRGTISDVGTRNCNVITPYSSVAQNYPSVGGFVGRAASGVISRSFIHGIVFPHNAPISSPPEVGEGEIRAVSPVWTRSMIHNGFFGAQGGNSTLQAPVFNGVLVLSSDEHSGQSGELPNGLRVLDAAVDPDAWLRSNQYVYTAGDQRDVSWSNDTITTTNSICGIATIDRVWKFTADQTLASAPVPFIMDRCP